MPFLSSQKKVIMFGFFKKDPARELREQYVKFPEKACDLQCMGDIRGYAQKSAQAEKLELLSRS